METEDYEALIRKLWKMSGAKFMLSQEIVFTGGAVRVDPMSLDLPEGLSSEEFQTLIDLGLA